LRRNSFRISILASLVPSGASTRQECFDRSRSVDRLLIFQVRDAQNSLFCEIGKIKRELGSNAFKAQLFLLRTRFFRMSTAANPNEDVPMVLAGCCVSFAAAYVL
jgi:hypothetical protein